MLVRDVACLSVVFVVTSCGSDPSLFRSLHEVSDPKIPPGSGGAPGTGEVLESGGAPWSLGGAVSTGGVPGASGSPSPGTGGSSPGGSSPAGPSPGGARSGGAPGSGGSKDGADSGAVVDAAPNTPSTGVLPPIKDPGEAGPYTPVTTKNIGPNGAYTAVAPMELGKNGIKHPILVWAPGTAANPAIYQTLLAHFASHGFVAISYNTTPTGPELTAAIDFMITESNTRQDSPFYGKVDLTKIAAGGQATGSSAVYAVANDPRWTTTLHINGGTAAPHTAAMNLVKPAQFICGDNPSSVGGDGIAKGDLARPNCDADFQTVNAPVWYGDVIGASYTTVIDNPLTPQSTSDPLKKPFLAATVAWLRWQLAGDLTMKPMFVGSNCGFCQQTSTWTVSQKNLQ